MNQSRIDEALRATLDDRRLSRGERSALGDLLDGLEPAGFALLRSRVFALAAERGDVLEWCEDVIQLAAAKEADARRGATGTSRQFAYFSPEDACPRRIVEQIDGARETLDVCVFTLTDNRLSAAVVAAHQRGVAVRIIADDDKAGDRGSDVLDLARAGIAVRLDRDDGHMHNKFALFDQRVLLTGSYNWTVGADRENQENFVVSDDSGLVKRFAAQFERLWKRFAGPRR